MRAGYTSKAQGGKGSCQGGRMRAMCHRFDEKKSEIAELTSAAWLIVTSCPAPSTVIIFDRVVLGSSDAI